MGEAASLFPFTEDERALRDRAWRFLMPARERSLFGAVRSGGDRLVIGGGVRQAPADRQHPGTGEVVEGGFEPLVASCVQQGDFGRPAPTAWNSLIDAAGTLAAREG
jgi:hypothetical protein